MDALWKDVAAGSVAGLAGGKALQAVSGLLYERVSYADRLRERAIEPRDPFVVLSHKLGDAIGHHPSDAEAKRFEQAAVLTVSATAGAAYVLLARTWPLGWLAGGAAFGALFWAVEDEGIGPALGLVGDNMRYPAEAHLRGLAAHVAFGVVTAGLLAAVGVPGRRA